MTKPQLITEAITFDGPGRNGQHGLKLTAKRYSADTSATVDDGLTLLFAHCIGSHKEQWEIVVEQLLLLQHAKQKNHQIREAISFDWQNHGDAAVLNEGALKSRPQGISVFEWSHAIASFVKTHLHGRRIVPMGHSAGAAAMMLITREFSIDVPAPFAAIILIEPTMITKELYTETKKDRETTMNFIMKGTYTRREAWPDKDEACRWLSKRFPWSLWDPRAVRLYTEYGLRTVTAPPDDPSSTHVILKCDKNQEAISYPDVEPHFEATTQLARVCRTIPVHFIFGDRNDVVPEYIQASLGDVSAGRIASSVARVEDAGHMVVQEQPEHLSRAIARVLDSIARPAPSSRL